MEPNPPRERLLAVVDRSPACVAAHDRDGWLALFSTDAVVEDPVGAAPHARTEARDPLGRFWDTFIAPNEIRFEVRADLVAGRTVARDVVIHTTLPNGFTIDVPAHLRYELVPDPDGEPRIAHLAAHWEARKLSAKALRGGWRGLTGVTALTGRMLRRLGVRGVAGYLRGLRKGAFRKGHAVATAFVAALRSGDEAALRALLADGSRLERPAGVPVAPAALLTAFGPERPFEVGPPVAAGWWLSFRCDVEGAPGLVFLELDPATRKVLAARFFG